MLCNFRDGDRRALADEFDDFWGSFLRTSHLSPVHGGGEEAAFTVVGELDVGPVFEGSFDARAGAPV